MLNDEGRAQFIPERAGVKSLQEYLDSSKGQQAAGETGGIQGWAGTLFGEPYAAGSWQDKLIEAFGGTHDDERELCEITLSELLAEFSDVKLADSQCVRVTGQSSRPENMTGLVYRRPQNITDSN